MDTTFKKFGLYTVDVEYLKYLHNVDDEVNFTEDKDYARKPFIGVLILVEGYNYFVPLSSPKEKHKSWKNADRDRFLVYEKIKTGTETPSDIIKPSDNDGEVLRILAALDIRKMIPVPVGLFTRVDINKQIDPCYKSLLVKEFLFCQNIQDDIKNKAAAIYEKQKRTGKIHSYYCDYAGLEKAASEYSKQ